MVRFDKISTSEKLYPYVDVTVAADYKNGTFGTVADGVFTAGATGFYVIMNIEDGDDAKTDEYVIKAGSHARVADLSKVNGVTVNITSAQLPSEGVEVGDAVVSNSNGILEVPGETPAENYIEITEITRFGANGKIVV